MVDEGDADGNTLMVSNLKARNLVGREEKGLGFDDAREVVGSQASVVSVYRGEVSFSNDIEDPSDRVEPNGPLKWRVWAAHAKSFDKGDERTGEAAGAYAYVTVESNNVEPTPDPAGHRDGVPTGPKPFV